jgi:ABC-type polysaccharide/polyol phosphate export permease
MVRMSQWAVALPRHGAHVVHANKTLIARSRRELAATAMVIVHLGSSVIAFIGLLGGLFALGTYPIEGVLLTLGAMALLLYSVAVLCGANSLSRH